MKYIIATIVLLMGLGCTATHKQYLLSIDKESVSVAHHKSIQIGVDKVIVPGYMEENLIATKKGDAQIIYRKGVWAVPASKALTDTLIQSFQIKFSNPDVYLFPWETDSESGIRIKVIVGQFIYSDGYVELRATYCIYDIKNSNKKSYMYVSKLESGEETLEIVRAMNRLFGGLADEIGNKL